MDLHCFRMSIIWTQLDKAYKTTGHNAQGGFSYTIKRVLTPDSRLSNTVKPVLSGRSKKTKNWLSRPIIA